MLRVALTGGIASGKTAVSDRLGEHGALVIDADLLAREVVAPGTSALEQVVQRFGSGVLTGDRLDRAALGRLVFADAAARRDLEAIVHPAVRARAAEIEAQAPPTGVVVHVIPLLVETGQHTDFDVVVVVDSDPEVQLQRLRSRSGLTATEADARLAAQATRAERLAAADVVLANSGTVAELQARADELWDELSRRARARVR